MDNKSIAEQYKEMVEMARKLTEEDVKLYPAITDKHECYQRHLIDMLAMNNDNNGLGV
jgi:hypothetical protein